ncbi:MAG: helix-turn-helix transcriptional regulator [Chloroflexi bacterium]|nr:helix-turn-helix transcriptional regulator [Chloroflexota bacterium]
MQRRRGRLTTGYDGRMLRRLRLERCPHLQQQEVVRQLAELSGFKLSKQNYSAMEFGRRAVPDGIVEAAARFYGVPLNTFREYWWRRVVQPDLVDPEIYDLLLPMAERPDWPVVRAELLSLLRRQQPAREMRQLVHS